MKKKKIVCLNFYLLKKNFYLFKSLILSKYSIYCHTYIIISFCKLFIYFYQFLFHQFYKYKYKQILTNNKNN